VCFVSFDTPLGNSAWYRNGNVIRRVTGFSVSFKTSASLIDEDVWASEWPAHRIPAATMAGA
jgi:hypothetical protein